MFEKKAKVKSGNIWDPKKYRIFAHIEYSSAYSVVEEYQCSSFDINKGFLILRLLDDGYYYINIDAVRSFTVKEIKEEAND